MTGALPGYAGGGHFMKMREYLKLLAANDGSDLYLSTGAPPAAKFHGTLKPIQKERLQPGEVKDLAYGLMDEGQQREFEEELELKKSSSTAYTPNEGMALSGWIPPTLAVR